MTRFFNTISRIGRLLLPCILLAAGPVMAQEPPIEPVTLQLKWGHQFQFAGYYLAKSRGYYRELGLDVTIIEGGPQVDVVDEVTSGRADFGVGTSSLLLDHAAGEPVVVLGVIYQHSPLTLVIATDSSVQAPPDLAGQPVMLEPGSGDLIAMLNSEGVSIEDLELRPHSGSIDALKAGAVRAMSAYITDELFLLDKHEIEYLTFSPRDYGIDFYGDNFFTRRAIAEERTAMAKRFREATVRGWEEARENPYAAIDLILSEYSQRKSRAHLLYEADGTLALMTNLVAPGHMERQRWEDIGATYVESGLLDAVPPLDGFLLEAPSGAIPAWIWKAVAIGGATVVVLGAAAAHLYSLNMALKKEIYCRIATEKNLRESRDTLEHTLRELRELKEIIPICAYCKNIRHDDGYWQQVEEYIAQHVGADFSHGICPACLDREFPDLA